MQVDVALEMDRAGQEPTARHDDTPAARAGAGPDRLANGTRAIGHAVADGAEASDVDHAVRKGWYPDPLQDRLGGLPGVLIVAAGRVGEPLAGQQWQDA